MVLLLGPGKAGIGGRGFVVEASSVADAEYGSQGRAKRAPGIYAKSAGALKERQKRIVLSHFQCSILNCCDPGASCSHRSHFAPGYLVPRLQRSKVQAFVQSL